MKNKILKYAKCSRNFVLYNKSEEIIFITKDSFNTRKTFNEVTFQRK